MGSQSQECAVLIDAGSSGSRFWIYSWIDDTNSWVNDVPSGLIAEESYEVEPGIIEYLDDTTAMEAEFQTGLDELLAYIEGEDDLCQDTGDIPMYLMATAGLRTESNDEVREILDAVELWFEANAPFDWRFATLLSGDEEATYAWIATNYVLGLLGDGEKVGILEMGGQSFQVAFESADEIIMDNSFNVDVFGTSYRIYAKSWNGFGLQAIWNTVDEIIATDEGKAFLGWNGTAYTHPCLQVGWYNDLSSKLDWALGGYYDSVNCSLLLEYLFEEYTVSDLCAYSNCSIAGAYVSTMESVDFYALSGFYFMVNALNRIDDSLGFSPSINDLSDALEEMCELNITQMSLQMDDFYSKYDAWRCYQGKIIYQMMSMLPNLGVSATITNDNAENENGVEGTWLVGALIELMQDDAVVEEDNTGNENKYLPFFIIFAVAFLIATIAICYLYSSRAKQAANTSPVDQL